MICAIMQPTYLPWMGYFDLMDQVDTFVFYDDVQLVRRSWGTRNRIKTAQGEQYLTLPVSRDKHRDETFFCAAQLTEDGKWRKKHLKTIRQAYAKAPFFEEVFTFIEPLLLRQVGIHADFTIGIIEGIAKRLGIGTRFVRSSILHAKGTKDDRLLGLCLELGARAYRSPQGSAAYINEKQTGGRFADSPVRLEYHHFVHPEYPQLHGAFISHLSILDALFNCGFERTLALIRQGRRPALAYHEVV